MTDFNTEPKQQDPNQDLINLFEKFYTLTKEYTIRKGIDDDPLDLVQLRSDIILGLAKRFTELYPKMVEEDNKDHEIMEELLKTIDTSFLRPKTEDDAFSKALDVNMITFQERNELRKKALLYDIVFVCTSHPCYGEPSLSGFDTLFKNYTNESSERLLLKKMLELAVMKVEELE